MPQPEGSQLAEVRARRERLREKYLRPRGERPHTTVQGVHHLALICRDVEETIQFYQEFLGFPLVELVENRDYGGVTEAATGRACTKGQEADGRGRRRPREDHRVPARRS